MESITLGQVAKTLAFFVGIIGSVIYLKKGIVHSLEVTIDKKLKPIKDEMNKLNKKTEKNNLENIKTDLINLMELADKEEISPEQKMRAYELYDYYSSHGGNSYVHDKWESLKKGGKL